MPSVFSPSHIIFAVSLLVTLISALPILHTIDNTPVGLSGIYTEVHTEPILPREQNSDNEHIGETGIWTEETPRLPRTVDKDGKAEVWVKAQFDPRAEVADGRGAKKGKWMSVANRFLPSDGSL